MSPLAFPAVSANACGLEATLSAPLSTALMAFRFFVFVLIDEL